MKVRKSPYKTLDFLKIVELHKIDKKHSLSQLRDFLENNTNIA